MKIKILYIIENAFFGGGERSFAQIIRGLDKERFEIFVACNPTGLFAQLVKPYAQIVPLDLKHIFNVAKIFYLKNFIRNNHIQIVHTQGSRADFFGRIAARLVKTPFLVSTVAMVVEGFNVGIVKKKIYMLFDRWTEKFVNRFVVVSSALEHIVHTQHKIPVEKIVKVHNGIELNEYAHNGQIHNSLRGELAIDKDTKVIAAIGRLVWQKGLPYLLQALKFILDKQNLKCLIVGEGDEKHNLEQMAKKSGLETHVIFTGFRQDIKEILRSIDLFVMPSLREGQPIILLEAMAMAKPIIATDIEGVKETINHGLTGLLVASGDPQALAESMLFLLGNEQKAKELGLAARKAAEARFDIQDTIHAHTMLYEGLIKNVS